MKRALPYIVTIFVLIVIAAILYPVFAQSPNRHRRNTELSTVKQLAVATIIYTGDHDERFPHASALPGLRACLVPYTKNAELFKETPGRSGSKEFNFNLAAVQSDAIPLGFPTAPPVEDTSVWYSISIIKDRPGAFHSRIDGSVKFVPLTQLFKTFEYQYPRDASSLAPADYLANQDPLGEKK